MELLINMSDEIFEELTFWAHKSGLPVEKEAVVQLRKGLERMMLVVPDFNLILGQKNDKKH